MDCVTANYVTVCYVTVYYGHVSFTTTSLSLVLVGNPCELNNGGCKGTCTVKDEVAECSCTAPLVLAGDKRTCSSKCKCGLRPLMKYTNQKVYLFIGVLEVLVIA